MTNYLFNFEESPSLSEDTRVAFVSPLFIDFQTMLNDNPISFSNDRYCVHGKLVYDHHGMPKCLCPSAFCGQRCNLQRRRLLINYRFDTSSSFLLPGVAIKLVFYLQFDNESSSVLDTEQIEHAPLTDSGKTFLLHLLYPHTLWSIPYSRVKIEAYRITFDSLTLLTAWSYVVPFANILPVQRLSVHLKLSDATTEPRIIGCNKCVYGRCFAYAESYELYCECMNGWAGKHCDQLSIHCEPNVCAPGALCIEQDPALCLCPRGCMGPTCRVMYKPCSSYTCKDGETCVWSDARCFWPACVCITPTGDDAVCDASNRSADLRDLSTSVAEIPIVAVHLLFAVSGRSASFLVPYERYVIQNVRTDLPMRLLPRYKYENSFDVILCQVFLHGTSSYYFGALFNSKNRILLWFPTDFHTRIKSTSSCAEVNELFNETVMTTFDPIKRLKLYQKPCRDNLLLRCFYDTITYICLCGQERTAECFFFDFKAGLCDHCKNDGVCVLKHVNNPLSYICVCSGRKYFNI